MLGFISRLYLSESLFSKSYITSRVLTVRFIRNSPALLLNRIFVDLDECVNEKDGLLVYLNSSDNRAVHIKNILKLSAGDGIRMGILGVGLTDLSNVEATDATCIKIRVGEKSNLLLNSKPLVDLVLAVPRPLRLERLLPVVSSMGVDRIFLVGASKVEKAFFGSHLFRVPEQMREALVEGLSQAGVDCHLPQVIVRRDLRKFVVEELDTFCPLNTTRRVVAHPQRLLENVSINSVRFSSIPPIPIPVPTHDSTVRNIDTLTPPNNHRIVVAVGPEGGWEDYELALLARAGFLGVHLGQRVLRTDTAVTALLALAHEWVASQQTADQSQGPVP